jgi:tRNA threonylcarbamoyladenosine biosynthesis protein TsaE
VGAAPLQWEYVVKSIEDLQLPAQKIAELSSQHPVIAFNGPMGAGKTTLIKQVCVQLHVTDETSSPTYSLVNEYATQNGKPVYHFDFYRINDIEEALDMGALEYFDSGNTCLIEWPEKVETLLPKQILIVNIEITESYRIVTIILPNENQ